ncbi:MAG: hypothetical protein K0S63_1302, partial [Gammaproteobacteria bacterium]|nr:hypothetical protein [Gammaproteobacteria bacterium]
MNNRQNLHIEEKHEYVKDEFNIEVPDAFECPITAEIMLDPLMASDGHSYERIAIEKWL